MKQITVIIRPDGQATATADGFEANQCRTATAFLKEALGKFTSEQLTAAYYLSETMPSVQQEGRS